MSGKKSKGHSFESALGRLEEIVNEMENGRLSLDEMAARFEEGTALSVFCEQKLNEVERKISLLMDREGTMQEVPFEPLPESANPELPLER